ncbi:MAG: choice-of-anchor J domain-containing protein, partial [Chitinophagaceae bacterium]|nr:choice-of-anchor J domain-containing protein [Chitinophagaceae bacterium]
MKKNFLTIGALILAFSSFAQTPYVLSGTSYTQDFDNIGSGMPLGWRVDSLVNPNAGLGNDAISKFSATASTWGNTGRGFKNLASADGLLATASTQDQNNSTDRVLGLRQVSAAGWDDKDSLISASFQIANTSGLTNFNLEFKIQSLNVGAKRYNNWIVQYGLGSNPNTFTTVTTNPAVITLDSNFTNTLVTVNFGSNLDNQNQSVWIRIMPSDTSQGTGNRPHVGIDDFKLSWTGIAVNNKPQILTLTPPDNATGVSAATSSLSIDFDKTIAIGSGNITIYNITDASNQVIAAANAVPSGMSVTIPGVSLIAGKDYAVQFDSTCFKSGAYNSYGIYNNTEWNFQTGPAVNPAQTSLNETFTGCLSPNLGSFIQKSVTGAQTWKCSKYGNTDTSAVYMNGYANGATNDNEDWLISPNLDMSAMANPYLSFWSKKRFSGNNTKEVFISNDYSGDVATATWNNLSVDFSNLDTIYSAFNNININNYKATPFYIAFKYESSAAGSADEWSIDD